MVILQPEDNVKVKTEKQKAIITRLLQSSYFSKREFIELMQRNRNQIASSYDASVLISYLISVLRYRKKFLSRRHRAHLKCDYCKARKYLTRIFNPTYNAQRIMCISCSDKYDELEKEQQQASENISKILTSQLHSDTEQAYEDKQKAKAFVKDMNKIPDDQKSAVVVVQNKPLDLQ